MRSCVCLFLGKEVCVYQRSVNSCGGKLWRRILKVWLSGIFLGDEKDIQRLGGRIIWIERE